jgi:hypothetical protein
MVDANIDIFEMYYEEYISDFKHLENLEKIRRTNGPNPSSLSADIVTRTTTTQLIAEQLPNLNSRKITRITLKPKLDSEKVFGLPFRRI